MRFQGGAQPPTISTPDDEVVEEDAPVVRRPPRRGAVSAEVYTDDDISNYVKKVSIVCTPNYLVILISTLIINFGPGNRKIPVTFFDCNRNDLSL